MKQLRQPHLNLFSTRTLRSKAKQNATMQKKNRKKSAAKHAAFNHKRLRTVTSRVKRIFCGKVNPQQNALTLSYSQRFHRFN